MNKYRLDGCEIDSVELKALLVSRGLKVDRKVYQRYGKSARLDVNPVACDCILLSDGTVVQLTDMGFHLKYLSGVLSWSNLKLLRYASQLGTDFSLRVEDSNDAGSRLTLYWREDFLDYVSLPPQTDFYHRKTANGLPFVGNAVLQGLDWVAFQCLWPCEFAASGHKCEYCFSGDVFEEFARKGKLQPAAVEAGDVGEIVASALWLDGCTCVQLTGGSTFDGMKEAFYLNGYLEAIAQAAAAVAGIAPSFPAVPDVPGTQEGAALPERASEKDTPSPIAEAKIAEMLLYITLPKEASLIDGYFARGASRIACSLEVADEQLAKRVTPGKIAFSTRQRHLDVLEYTAQRFGPGTAFSNFIIGLEPFESLRSGASALAERGILPTASVWMPMGRPVLGSMAPPGLDYYRRVKEHFAELYTRYRLEPPVSRGLNVCIERDIWNYAQGR
ncbi:MAG: hypothetical protein LBG81_03440 [Coriobacteriaceae bacterium]|jgi:hypothetical protein|nr:hypothetical protein [Coriobacteriaceae bacterium]